MEPILSYIDAISIEKVYFVALSLCLIISIRVEKIFHLALITILFSAISQLFLFDFLFYKGVEAWVIGWCAYELLLIASIISLRLTSKSIHNKFILSDILLIVGSVVQILVYLLTYISKSSGSAVMDAIYAATAPALYIFTIVVLAFPSIYRFIDSFIGNKELNSDNIRSNRSSRGIFSARVHSFILGY